MVIKLESVKMRISAPAHPSATGIGRVFGLVCYNHYDFYDLFLVYKEQILLVKEYSNEDMIRPEMKFLHHSTFSTIFLT